MRMRTLKPFLTITAFVVAFCSVFLLSSCGYNSDYIEATYKIENPYGSDIFTSSSTLTVSLTADENADENFVDCAYKIHNEIWYFTWNGLKDKVRKIEFKNIANYIWSVGVCFEESEGRPDKYFSFCSNDWLKSVEIYNTDIVFVRVD